MWLYFSKPMPEQDSIWRAPGPQSDRAAGAEEMLIGVEPVAAAIRYNGSLQF